VINDDPRRRSRRHPHSDRRHWQNRARFENAPPTCIARHAANVFGKADLNNGAFMVKPYARIGDVAPRNQGRHKRIAAQRCRFADNAKMSLTLIY
jgi:hypothetical protein